MCLIPLSSFAEKNAHLHNMQKLVPKFADLAQALLQTAIHAKLKTTLYFVILAMEVKDRHLTRKPA